MFRLLFFLPLLSFAANSTCEHTQTFVVEGVDTKLCHYQKMDAWVSESCLAPKANCDALKILNEAAKKYIEITPQEAMGGKNQGNIICNKLGGTIMIATLPPRGSQQSFCQGKDQSLVDGSALHANQPKEKL